MKRPRIVIKVEGGLITHVLSDQPVEALVIDYDIDGVDEDTIVSVGDDQFVVTDRYILNSSRSDRIKRLYAALDSHSGSSGSPPSRVSAT